MSDFVRWCELLVDQHDFKANYKKTLAYDLELRRCFVYTFNVILLIMENNKSLQILIFLTQKKTPYIVNNIQTSIDNETGYISSLCMKNFPISYHKDMFYVCIYTYPLCYISHNTPLNWL